MKREHYILLGGGGLLLWLLLRGKKTTCPLNSVLRWQDLAVKVNQESENLYGREAAILAIIQDQSQGDPNQIYYSGGAWKRYGLCGVPLAWAQEFNPKIKPEDLLDPKFNIDIMLKIMRYIDVKITQSYQRAGINLSVGGSSASASFSANTYSTYYHSNTMDITARDPNIHQGETLNRYMDLLNCYRQVIKY